MMYYCREVFMSLQQCFSRTVTVWTRGRIGPKKWKQMREWAGKLRWGEWADCKAGALEGLSRGPGGPRLQTHTHRNRHGQGKTGNTRKHWGKPLGNGHGRDKDSVLGDNGSITIPTPVVFGCGQVPTCVSCDLHSVQVPIGTVVCGFTSYHWNIADLTNQSNTWLSQAQMILLDWFNFHIKKK